MHATPATAKADVHRSIRGTGATKLPRIDAATGTPHRSHAMRRCVRSFRVQISLMDSGDATGSSHEPCPFGAEVALREHVPPLGQQPHGTPRDADGDQGVD